MKNKLRWLKRISMFLHELTNPILKHNKIFGKRFFPGKQVNYCFHFLFMFLNFFPQVIYFRNISLFSAQLLEAECVLPLVVAISGRVSSDTPINCEFSGLRGVIVEETVMDVIFFVRVHSTRH